jgi:hypothetical protein
MLDLCFFAVTKRAIFRVNRLERVNLQSDHIARILDGFMATAVSYDIVESFKNAGDSLRLDDDRVLRRLITPGTTRWILRAPFADPFASLALGPEADEADDPNVEVSAAQSSRCRATRWVRGMGKRECLWKRSMGVGLATAYFGNNF